VRARCLFAEIDFMTTRRFALGVAPALTFALFATVLRAEPQSSYKFDFGAPAATAGRIALTKVEPYSTERGYGFEGSPQLKFVGAAGGGGDHYLTSDKPFFFSMDVPEGNYRVTVAFGAKDLPSDTTVKAELRRLMLEKVHTDPGETVTKSFIVNVRTPQYPGGRVRLKAPRESVQEAWAWDSRITLEFNNAHPVIRSVEVEKVDVPTVYILGDSTSCDQSREPYCSWGQMFTRFFKDDIAIANHGESGESVGSSNGAHRFDKILSLIKPGDYFITQFGHNDMKGTAPEVYKAGLVKWVAAIKAKGATPIIVTPVSRYSFSNGVITNSLKEFPQAARDAAKESGAGLVDLTEMSKSMYEAMGPEAAHQLFEHQNGKYDGTHHSPYGAYQIAQCVIEGIRKSNPGLAGHLVADYKPFDITHPQKESDFAVPPTPLATSETPFGN
jgi:lysophospholipase L1-like esterase